jgi:hypothetical protein
VTLLWFRFVDKGASKPDRHAWESIEQHQPKTHFVQDCHKQRRDNVNFLNVFFVRDPTKKIVAKVETIISFSCICICI